MDIRNFMDLKMLQYIQDLFSDATGLAAIAVDAKGNYITKGSNFTDFCMKYTRQSTEGAKRCAKCDNECKGTYFCHAGLMDFASDIIVEGEKVGAIIGGQVLPNEPDLDKFREIAGELEINEDKYIAALKKVPIRSEKMIRSSAELLGFMVNQLVNLEYIKKINDKKIKVFDSESGKTFDAVSRIKNKTSELKNFSTMENILSLNASIEAARAGQAGVGFAVVANQIGELSKKSAETYDEITSLIGEIESSVDKIVNVKL